MLIPWSVVLIVNVCCTCVNGTALWFKGKRSVFEAKTKTLCWLLQPSSILKVPFKAAVFKSFLEPGAIFIYDRFEWSTCSVTADPWRDLHGKKVQLIRGLLWVWRELTYHHALKRKLPAQLESSCGSHFNSTWAILRIQCCSPVLLSWIIHIRNIGLSAIWMNRDCSDYILYFNNSPWSI